MSLFRPLLQKILRALAVGVYRHPKWTATFFALLTAGGIYLTAFKLGVMNDTNALIRQDSPVLNYFLDYVREFDAADPIAVVIQSPDFEKNRQAAEALAEQFSKRPDEIKAIYYKNDLSRLKPHFLLYEDKDKLNDILKQLRAQRALLNGGESNKTVNLNYLLNEALRQFEAVEKAKGKRGTLDDLGAFAERMVRNLERLAQDLEPTAPVEEEDDSEEMVPEADEFEREVLKNTYLAFEDGSLVLMMLTPGEGDEGSFSPQETTIRHLREDIARLQPQFPGVNMGLTGEPVLLDDELKQSTRDMIKASLIAFVLISLLFFAAYREFYRPALAIFALVCALFWSLGFTVLAVGHLNIISQAFVLMLLGLGIDFGIQLLGRYEEERAKERSVLEALENALQFTGMAVLTSGGITAIAFYTMCFNDFLGLAELGVIAGSGVIFCMLANLILLPALLAWFDGGKNRVLPVHHRKQAEFGKKLDALLLSRPKTVLVLVMAGTLLASWLARNVRFDHNLLNLQNPSIESVKLAHQLLDSPAQSFLFGVIVAEDMEDAREKTAALEALPTVRSINSPTKILPQNQDEKLEILKKIRKELDQLRFNPDVTSKVDVTEARENLRTLLEDSRKGYAEAKKFRRAKDPRAQQAFDIFEKLIPALEQSVESLKELSQEEAGRRLNRFQLNLLKRMKQDFEFLKSFDLETPVTLEDLPPQALERYISPNGKVLLEVFPEGNVWEREYNEKFVRDLRSVDPAATGTPVQNYVYIDILKKSFVQAGWWAFLAIVVVVGLYFRSVTRLALTLIPLVIGILWTLGMMGAFGIMFNPANIITLPLVIGIGVAYGVYIVDRYIEEGKVNLFGSSTGKAVLMSALTTMCGFSAMMLGNYQGLVSLGLLMTAGIGFCFLASTVVLPQMFMLLDGRRSRTKPPSKAPIKPPSTR